MIEHPYQVGRILVFIDQALIVPDTAVHLHEAPVIASPLFDENGSVVLVPIGLEDRPTVVFVHIANIIDVRDDVGC